MNKRACILLLLLAVSSFSLLSHAKKDPVVITAGTEVVTLNELLRMAGKHPEKYNSVSSVDSLIDIAIDFKLKIAAAKKAGIDTMASLTNEMDRYARELALPYLRDKRVDDSLVRVAYSHMQEVIDVNHVFLEAPDNPDERRLISTKADSLRATLSGDCQFGNNAEVTGGIWPYFFEDLAFNTPIGAISPVEESPYGFHIIRVNNRRPNPGAVKTRHILKLTANLSEEEATEKKRQIDSIYTLLKSGADFPTVAATETDDPQGKQNGGDLPWFGPGQMAKEFSEKAFSLKPGEISHPVKTQFGWHIILCEETRPIEPFDSVKTSLRNRIMSDERSLMAIEHTAERWKESHPDKKGLNLQDAIGEMTKGLPETNREYRELLSDYRNGLMLFEISDREVWKRATSDSAALEKYFIRHRDEFQWNRPRYKGYLVSAINDSIAETAVAILSEALKNDPEAAKPIPVRKRFGNDVKVDMIIVARGDNKIIDYLCFKGDVPDDNRWKAFRTLNGRILTSPEHASDTKGDVVRRYQEELIRKWVEALRSKYPVKTDRRAIHEAFGF